jgi:hypothetical protein
MWRYEEFLSGEGTTFDSAATAAFRPEQADWSASGLTSSPTTSSTFGIVRAATNEPRFDHDPVTLACRGLLIEESRTNLTTQSANAGSWPNSNGTVTNNGSTTAPDGSSNGFLGGIGTATLLTFGTSSVTGLHTGSVFLKRNNTDWVRIQMVQGVNLHSVNFWVNLATGAAGTLSIGAGTATSISSQITPFADGWYRCSITASFPVTDFIQLAIISASANNNFTRVSGSVYAIWGAQTEAGSFATSYIPTTTGSVVRSADVCSITGANFTSFYNSTEGSVFVGVVPYAPQNNVNNQFIVDIGDGGSTNRTRLFRAQTSGASTLTGTSSNVTDLGITGANSSTLASSKFAFSMKLNDFALSKDGALSGIDTIANMMDAVTTMTIGNSTVAAQPINGTITAIRYYRKRLPNAKLAQLTV